MRHTFLFLIVLFLAEPACTAIPKLKSGRWYSEMQITPSTSLPFTFTLEYNKQNTRLFIINAQEQIELKDVTFSDDSIFVKFPAFDSELRGRVTKKKVITGAWHNHAKKGNYQIPFLAQYGNKPRFSKKPSLFDVSGRWEVTFSYKEDPYKAVGIFETDHEVADINEDVVCGTFRTETGDYRFLEGVVSGDSLLLSTFDGSHAFLFTAQYKNDSLKGTFYSGKHYQTEWYAVKNANYELPHPDSLTYLVNDTPITIELPKPDSSIYHFPNEETKGKVTLIQIMGTWCPNCLDESVFLGDISKKYSDNLNIIAVAFETPRTFEAKSAKLNKYKAALDLDYTFLVGGAACKSCARELFPMMNEIISFPTLVFIDKKGNIRKIHTGFNGPGTGKYYDDFVSSTTAFIEELINE